MVQAILAIPSVPQANAQALPSTAEELIHEIPANIEPNLIIISRDGAHFGYMGTSQNESEKKMWLIVDGLRVHADWDVVGFGFTESGHAVVQIRRNGDYRLDIGGIKNYELKDLASGVRIDRIVCSMDGQRIAYVGEARAGTGGPGQFIVVDGQSQQHYSAVGRPVFSPDGKRVAYGAIAGNKKFVVVDGKEGPAFASVGEPEFSPDSSKIAYVAKADKKRYTIVVDGVPGPVFDDFITGPLFSPDGKLVYAAGHENKMAVYVASQPQAEVPLRRGRVSLLSDILFSPDGKRMAFLAIHGRARFTEALDEGREYKALRSVIVDGQAQREYDIPAIYGLRFSPDSHHFAYEVHEDTWPSEVKGTGKGRAFVVLDGKEGAPYESLIRGSISFTPTALRYWVRKGSKLYRISQPLP
jgi:hypothetical protein